MQVYIYIRGEKIIHRVISRCNFLSIFPCFLTYPHRSWLVNARASYEVEGTGLTSPIRHLALKSKSFFIATKQTANMLLLGVYTLDT